MVNERWNIFDFFTKNFWKRSLKCNSSSTNFVPSVRVPKGRTASFWLLLRSVAGTKRRLCWGRGGSVLFCDDVAHAASTVLPIIDELRKSNAAGRFGWDDAFATFCDPYKLLLSYFLWVFLFTLSLYENGRSRFENVYRFTSVLFRSLQLTSADVLDDEWHVLVEFKRRCFRQRDTLSLAFFCDKSNTSFQINKATV